MNGDYSVTNANTEADEDHCDSLFDRQFLEDDLEELMLGNEAQYVRGTPEMAFYAWDCNGVKEDEAYAERNVPMGGEVVAFARDGRICTTGIATCVAIAVRAYSKEGDLVFDYLKHDPEFASATLDDKLRTLYDGLRTIQSTSF